MSRNVDSTYSHTVRILQKLEDHGLAEGEEEGRKKNYKLTEEGQERAEALRDFLEAGGDTSE